MGIYSTSFPCAWFQVQGTSATEEASLSNGLQQGAFQSIENTADEETWGWVELDDNDRAEFDVPGAYERGDYWVLTLRRDQRKLPAALVRTYVQRAAKARLASQPQRERLSKAELKNLREEITHDLLRQTLPTPSCVDVLWHRPTDQVVITSLQNKQLDTVVELFKSSFPGLRLVAQHPLGWARQLVANEAGQEQLEQLNAAPAGDVLAEIQHNRWLGCDFLLWLLWRTLHSDSVYGVTATGPAAAGDSFVAYLNERLVLLGGGDEGVQKITVSGPQESFQEVVSALNAGKEPVEGQLYLEKDGFLWRLTLKGERFHWGSFKPPALPVTAEAGETAQQARFYERLQGLEGGRQLFSSLLAAFLHQRLDPQAWQAWQQQYQQWLQGQAPAAD